jgi:N-acetylmuramic acid 6-phosphate etherase
MPVPTRKHRHASQPQTEQRNPASKNLDRMSSLEIVRLMNREDGKVATAVARQLPAIARSVDAIAQKVAQGGRLIYVGAGTSGRIALLDAAECPATFGISPQVVRALIAGGKKAVTQAVEGAEDRSQDAKRDLKTIRLTKKDVVVGIAASGTTPYVVSAITFAKKRNALTIALSCNRNSPLQRAAKIAITTEVGPEVLTGSSRLKAGTAQKLVLNMLSTAVMVRLGYVYDNLMIDMALSNHKLKARMKNILGAATGNDLSAVDHALRQSKHNPRVTLVMLKCKLPAKKAQQRLQAANWNLRDALGE